MADSHKTHVRAVIYCRMSLAKYGDTVKVKRQEKLCRATAARLGWEVRHVYCDNNKSAWRRDRQRPDWDAMLASVERGEVDAVIIYHGDRLIRQPYDLETLLNLTDGRGIRLASPTGTRNLDDADDRYRLRLDVAKACNESDTISRRTRDAHADRAAKGIMRRGGYRPFGFKRSGKIKEDEAAEYRDAVARLIAGESKLSILKDWRARGVKTTAGNDWDHAGLSRMLARPRYAGLSTYKGEIVGKGKWKPIIERSTWDALQAATATGRARWALYPEKQTSSAMYLLTGIAVHAACGDTVKVHHSGTEQRIGYRCKNPDCTSRVRRDMANVDAYVIGRVLRRLSDPQLWEQVEAAAAAGDDAGAQLAVLTARRAATVEQFTRSTTMTPAALDAVLRQMDEQIGQVRARIAQRTTKHVLDGLRDLTREEWDALPLDRRRSIVRGLVTVELLPSRRGNIFDASSVRVKRRRIDAGAGKGPGGLELVNGPAPE